MAALGWKLALGSAAYCAYAAFDSFPLCLGATLYGFAGEKVGENGGAP